MLWIGLAACSHPRTCRDCFLRCTTCIHCSVARKPIVSMPVTFRTYRDRPLRRDAESTPPSRMPARVATPASGSAWRPMRMEREGRAESFRDAKQLRAVRLYTIAELIQRNSREARLWMCMEEGLHERHGIQAARWRALGLGLRCLDARGPAPNQRSGLGTRTRSLCSGLNCARLQRPDANGSERAHAHCRTRDRADDHHHRIDAAIALFLFFVDLYCHRAHRARPKRVCARPLAAAMRCVRTRRFVGELGADGAEGRWLAWRHGLVRPPHAREAERRIGARAGRLVADGRARGRHPVARVAHPEAGQVGAVACRLHAQLAARDRVPAPTGVVVPCTREAERAIRAGRDVHHCPARGGRWVAGVAHPETGQVGIGAAPRLGGDLRARRGHGATRSTFSPLTSDAHDPLAVTQVPDGRRAAARRSRDALARERRPAAVERRGSSAEVLAEYLRAHGWWATMPTQGVP